ncbi:MAG: DUF2490 domain-containing protein [Bacteroides sp.]|nr:DUF2490 domain-containing protein [Roseburia sp.]MCM1347236.1 DUF2490 domain-containing protein [Bacteroides sp.]MCM1421715.1 DUF2490 domain-containing protein [Bacteroides sp.]
MKRIHILLFALIAGLGGKAVAQTDSGNDDFGTDLSVSFDKKLAPRLNLGIEGSMRTQSNSERVDRYTVGADLSYKFIKRKTFGMKVSGGFEYMWVQKLSETKEKHGDVFDETLGEYVRGVNGYNITDRYWRNRHRTTLSVSGEYSPSKRWSFTLKETMQYNHYCAEDSVGRTKIRYKYNDDDEMYTTETRDLKAVNPKDRFVLRSKFTAEYNIKGLPVNPFASLDYGYGINYTAHKWKLSAGADYKLNKKNKLTVFYRFQTDDDDDEPNGHIVGVGYKLSF